ncbi:MAG: PhzF family phenazine biosynthesis protein [Alteromonadaceae bacterium]|nr:PhzF family phenazine biosynthesis protein [Alteromonadaceae bacterium]
MKLKINIIDTFTDVIFKGNSAAVIIIQDWLTDDLMQSIAIENNLSETAYVKKIGTQDFEIRWFSPITEIDFCGHATLASAFVLFSDNPDFSNITFFAEAVGKLSVTKKDNGYIQMSFPNQAPEPVTDIPSDLLKGLSIAPAEVLMNRQAYFVVYSSEKDVLSVVQYKEFLKKLTPYDVVVTAKSEEYDFVSRYFWPANGGDEDPATGSIHTGLAPYWSEKLGKTELNAFQASTRGGVLHCRVEGDRVYISGKAVQYLEGHITV